MFERTRAHPTTYIRDDSDDSLIVAIRWVLEQAHDNGGMPLLYAPGKQNVIAREPVRAFAERYPTMTPRTRYTSDWRGGPVLAAWPDDKMLGEIGDNPRTTALCVVQWGEKPLAWVAAAGAVSLSPITNESPSLPTMDPIVRQGLIQLGQSVNHSNALTGSTDKADAVAFFRILVDNRLPIEADGLYAHALAEGWPERGAARLRDMAARVASGGRPRGWNLTRWRPEVVDRWRQAAAGED